jgi:galactose mutarotase-like enzyme
MQTITIFSEDRSSKASFCPELGGLCYSIFTDGRELLYWPAGFNLESYSEICGGWPFLFPICGRLKKPSEYDIGLHGFAWNMPWDVTDRGDHFIEMCFESNYDTLRVYPFKFKVTLRYEISDGELICQQKYENLSNVEMPYYAGFHPYFLTEDKDHVIFDYNPVQGLSYNDDLTDVVGECLPPVTPTKVTDPNLNEKLVVMGDNKLSSLKLNDGSKIELSADSDLFPYVQLYTVPGEPFFCIEPWMGVPNALNHKSKLRIVPSFSIDEASLILKFLKK